MAVSVSVRRLRIESETTPFTNRSTYSGYATHRELGRRLGNVDTDFLSKSFTLDFNVPFLVKPIGWIRLYRMVLQGGKWIQQDVAYHHAIEDWLDETHFELEIADFESLDGIILEWYFTE